MSAVQIAFTSDLPLHSGLCRHCLDAWHGAAVAAAALLHAGDGIRAAAARSFLMFQIRKNAR